MFLVTTTVEPYLTTVPFIRPYSFDPNVKITELFYYCEDSVNAVTLLLRQGFYGAFYGGRFNQGLQCRYFKSSVTHTDKYNDCVLLDLNSYFTIDFVEWIHASAHWSQEKQNRYCTHSAEARDGP